MSTAIPVLLYHAVGRHPSAEFAPFTIDRSALAEHLDLIVERGYRTMTFAELVQRLQRDGSVPERTLVLTFDDGFVDFATDAWPEIAKRQMVATLYMTAGAMGANASWLDEIGAGDLRLLDEDQLRALQRDGCEIGAHSFSHPSLDCLRVDQARDQIVRSRDVLAEVLDEPSTTFAYPHGHHSRTTRRLVIEAGFEGACAVKNRLSHAHDDPFAIARITVTRDVTVEHLDSILEGRSAKRVSKHEPLRTTAYRALRRHRHRRQTRNDMRKQQPA